MDNVLGVLPNGPPVPSLHHEDFTVAWICALPVEMAAAEALLDERLPNLPAKPHDHNTYIFGSIHGHRIVIACLPAGVYGTTSAATLATEVRTSFPSLRFGLMVGVGGGVRHAGVQLGDVVVSKPSREYGGVIQYDYGKAVAGGEWEHTGMLNKPPTVLLTAIARLQAAHLQRPNRVSEIAAEVLAAHPGMVPTFGRPIPSEDGVTEEFSTGCKIHYGLIASGNKVVKDEKLRDEIAHRFGILCFEMEAAGLMDNFPCLVVRGICDYADSQKNKDWQGYASLTAAVYAKELLEVIPRHSVTQAPAAISYLDWHVEHYFPSKDPHSTGWVSTTKPAFDEVFLERITPYDHERIHQRISRKRLVGTTQWFLNHSKFQAWFSDREYPFLWCSGKIGSGKSIIAATVIEEARLKLSPLGIPTVFFYCDEQYASEPALLLSSFIRQLTEFFMDRHQGISNGSQKLLQKYFNVKREAPDLEDLEHVFASLYTDVSNAIYVVDGLDALKQKDARWLLIYFRSLFEACHGEATGPRLLIVSREYFVGGTNVATYLPNIHQISTTGNVTHDIEIYIKESIADRMMVKQLTNSEELIDRMKGILLRESSEMFLWVYLQVEIIWYTCATESEICSALASLPKDLEETYNRCAQRINYQDFRALRTLVWVRYSARPLHCEELREAVAFDIHDTVWDSTKIPRGDFLLGWCANLVVLDSLDGCARFAHPSVCQYLDDRGSLSIFPKSIQLGNQICGRLCITYLSFADFHLQLDRTPDEHPTWSLRSPDLVPKDVPGFRVIERFLPSRLKRKQCISLPLRSIRTASMPSAARYRFLGYARRHWTTHTRHLELDEPLWGDFARLAMTLNETWRIHPWKTDGSSQESYLRAMFGWAVREHHIPLMHLSLLSSNDANMICDLPLAGELLPALHYVCKQGYDDMIPCLLHYCDVTRPDLQGFTPLQYAVEKGRFHTVNLLLRPTLRALMDPSYIDELLLLSSSKGHTDIVKLLIQHGAFLEVQNSKSQTSLMVAAAAGHISTVELLMQRGADEDATDREGGTARLYALRNRHWMVFNLFLNMDLKRASCKLEDMLLSAVEMDDPEFAIFLIGKGLDPNAEYELDTGHGSGTVLTWAAGKGPGKLDASCSGCSIWA
ncbi:hypothetical protein BO94DRAFT_148466 [Aspergillus sclerotioniger CBS 115572]|uniref:Uncharacterized protein n=1 Tax=Aspergillus sclerotioniger CBS 115572 TaxID=1450535 RepID=A0A317W6J9_9EURO|nr:hypothetical protein BO94DRAFT_148466 [Aspergillus sclerotioniger CBS 115572]PWY81729.1 hypothetical protein BO94DRAFT_148466 [Aspergillus sclerotioniger CBS 115572]